MDWSGADSAEKSRSPALDWVAESLEDTWKGEREMVSSLSDIGLGAKACLSECAEKVASVPDDYSFSGPAPAACDAACRAAVFRTGIAGASFFLSVAGFGRESGDCAGFGAGVPAAGT